jgi:hypothetical protein
MQTSQLCNKGTNITPNFRNLEDNYFVFIDIIKLRSITRRESPMG